MVTVATRRRRGEPLTTDEERAVWESIVSYDDEGGGEEDTEAFDMFTLRQTNTNPVRPQLRTDKNWLSQNLMRDRLQEADLDVTRPPYDSLQTYEYEGTGSVPESLSSLNSSGSEQDYSFLRHWGSKFMKLADLYEHREGGGEAS